MFGIVGLGLGLGQFSRQGGHNCFDFIRIINLHRTTADQLISDYTRTKTMNKAEKLKNNREKAILEVILKMENLYKTKDLKIWSMDNLYK